MLLWFKFRTSVFEVWIKVIFNCFWNQSINNLKWCRKDDCTFHRHLVSVIFDLKIRTMIKFSPATNHIFFSIMMQYIFAFFDTDYLTDFGGIKKNQDLSVLYLSRHLLSYFCTLLICKSGCRNKESIQRVSALCAITGILHCNMFLYTTHLYSRFQICCWSLTKRNLHPEIFLYKWHFVQTTPA